MSDVVLSAALRSNLLSLQTTQKLIDSTQIRLATGLKVNSALDNPQSFFAAQSLTNRANDLSRLLDGIGQSVQALKQADNTITALTTLLNQADSIATSARDAITGASSGGAVIESSGVDYSDIDDLGATLTGLADTDELFFQITDSDGNAITLANNDAAGAGVVVIENADSAEILVQKINDLNNTTELSGAPVIKASITSAGNLRIETLNGESLRFTVRETGDAADLPAAAALGFTQLSENSVTAIAGAADESRATIVAGSKLESQGFYSAASTIATGSTLLTALTDEAGATLGFSGTDDDSIILGINGGTEVDVLDIEGATNNDVVSANNNHASLNTLIRADFDTDTGVFSIQAISNTTTSIQVGVLGDDTNASTAGIGFGFSAYDVAADVADGGGAVYNSESFILSSGGGSLAQLEGDYNKVRDQIDQLVRDSAYRGTNLLFGDDLITFFNADQSSSLTVEGTTFTSSGLGIAEASFGSLGTIDEALNQVRLATDAVRSYATTLGTSLSIMQTRQDFTTQTINALKAGADELTVADQNEEGANLLALQTRQQLGVTSLSLAAQSQQSVLRLF
jgi:flagellin